MKTLALIVGFLAVTTLSAVGGFDYASGKVGILPEAWTAHAGDRCACNPTCCDGGDCCVTGTCCQAGAECCYEGSPCCGTSAKVAKQSAECSACCQGD
jgi:hypothetical protein